jgi:Phage integrase, N-terminal SAM-like domain
MLGRDAAFQRPASLFGEMSMTPLRQRYAERLRNKSPRTIETYVLRVRQFAEHFGKSPDELGPDELRAYQQHLLQRQVSWSMFNQSVCICRSTKGRACCRRCSARRFGTTACWPTANARHG